MWNAGFILTTLLSLLLSVLLFTSVADSRLSFLVLASMALALELGKIVTLHRPVIAGLLIGVSVLGSAGGLSRALDTAGDDLQQVEQQRRLILTEIDQNTRAIDRYLELDLIRRDALPLQERNRELREQLNDLPEVDVPELTSVLSLLSTLLALPLAWVEAAVVVLLAGLLDALMVTFIRGGGGHDPDRAPLPAPRATPANVEVMDDSYPVFKRQMLSRRDAGEPVLSQRACVREFGYRDRQVRGFFARLQREGLVEKRGGQFEWATSGKMATFSLL